MTTKLNAYGFINTAHGMSMHWCEELEDITPEELLILVYDYVDAVEDGCEGGAEYKRRIGEGNLRSYVDCLKAGNYNAGRHVPGLPYVQQAGRGNRNAEAVWYWDTIHSYVCKNCGHEHHNKYLYCLECGFGRWGRRASR